MYLLLNMVIFQPAMLVYLPEGSQFFFQSDLRLRIPYGILGGKFGGLQISMFSYNP